jgi:hypothetical protein
LTIELHNQFDFLGILRESNHTIANDPAHLKQYMIRHTKAQRIHGSSALALPKSTITVTMINMTTSEKQRYDATRAE